jgi:GT2 family glycosyltransferase
MDIELDLSVCLVMQSALSSLRSFLISLDKNSDPVAYETILVYHPSQQPAADLLAVEFPRLTLFETDSDDSLAARRNHAARIASGRYLLFCADDTIIRPDSLQGLLRFLDDTPDVGIAAPRIVDSTGTALPSTRTFPSPATVFLQHSFLGQRLPASRILKTHLMIGDHLASFEPDWLIGTFLVVRRELLDDIGLFDEGFVSFYADADLCLRAHRAGWHVRYLADALVMHDRPEIYGPLHALATSTNPAFGDGLRFLLKKWLKPAKMLESPGRR